MELSVSGRERILAQPFSQSLCNLSSELCLAHCNMGLSGKKNIIISFSALIELNLDHDIVC